MRRLISTSPIAAILLAIAMPVSGASMVYDTGLRLAYDSNQSNADKGTDKEEGFITTFDVVARYRTLLGQGVGLQIEGLGEVNANTRYGDLSNAAAGGRVRLNFKPVPGYTAPWYALHGSVRLRGYNDSELQIGRAHV